MAKSVRERQKEFISRQKSLGRHQRYFWVNDTEYYALKNQLKAIRERIARKGI